MLKGKERAHSPVKYSALAISVSAQKTSGPAINRRMPSADLSFSPFISEGLVSLGAEGGTIPVKILRDTRSSESFILQSVLPFSPMSDASKWVLVLWECVLVYGVPETRVSF